MFGDELHLTAITPLGNQFVAATTRNWLKNVKIFVVIIDFSLVGRKVLECVRVVSAGVQNGSRRLQIIPASA